MRMYDLIMKKRNGEALNHQEIQYLVEEYVAGNIPDYQMSAFLMAVYFQGMTEEETLAMTLAVAHSGDMVDLSGIEGTKVDKHSTGGVGDKTTLIIAPIVAACGAKVAKMSGRGLGHTGGTVDKLESIPGLRTTLTREEFFEVVNKTGVSVIGQSGNLAPADKKLYALRDVTATVDSIPLIAVSIMSKKLAAGNDCILLDVKTGSGAFMKTLEDSVALAKEMVSIGENAGKRTVALITNMDIPLGHNIGNSLEVIEAVETLKGNGPQDLTVVCMHLASNMLYLAGKGTLDECKSMVKEVIANGKALEHLAAIRRSLQKLHILMKFARRNLDILHLWIRRAVESLLQCWEPEERRKTVGLISRQVLSFTKKWEIMWKKASLWRLCMLPEKNYLKRQRSVICQQ